MRHSALPLIPIVVLQAVAQVPLRVDVPLPRELDLRGADATVLLPRDPRDATQVEAARQAWVARVAGLAQAPSVRVCLPAGATRLRLLLAAAQALKAQSPGQRVFVAFEPGATPILDEDAWGAVDGGVLLPGDLGPDPGTWRSLLARAQAFFPGRSWTLWLPTDPGALAATLLGDGARLVVPGQGPAASLAAAVPPEYQDVEGGEGDLTLRAASGKALRWHFQAGAWVPEPLPKERHEVAVNAADAYDVGALLAKVRAAQLRARAGVRTLEAKADLDLHIQGQSGRGGDLGFSFRYFEQAGEWPELLQKEVRLNGVRAKLQGEVQLPLIESRQSIAVPVALGLTEHYRYRDGGAAGSGRRRLRFEPATPDPLAYTGELEVEEATGRILVEHRERTDLPGTVKSERETLTYGEAAPGVWRPLAVQSFERWVSADGVIQVQRKFSYREFVVNGARFDEDRVQARSSDATMLKVTPEGARYFTRQGDGTRKIEEHAKSNGRALAGVVLADAGMSPPVAAFPALVYFDYNAFGKGAQLSALTAGVFNTASLAIPRGLGSFDVSANATVMLLKSTERPVVDGKLSDQDGVGHRFGMMGLELGHDLGLGFRLEGRGDFQYDAYSLGDMKYRTPDYALPPSGLTRTGTLQASWLFRGFQLSAFQGWGQRPEGTYGTPADPQVVPEGGAFQKWGGSLGYDRETLPGFWFHGEVGKAGGRSFDRFLSLDVGGMGGAMHVAGIRANALSADQVTWAKTSLTIPTGPSLRLALSLETARARSLDDQQTYAVSGLGIAGDVPGFGWFTAVHLDLGIGLQSDIAGVKGVTGMVALLRVF